MISGIGCRQFPLKRASLIMAVGAIRAGFASDCRERIRAPEALRNENHGRERFDIDRTSGRRPSLNH